MIKKRFFILPLLLLLPFSSCRRTASSGIVLAKVGDQVITVDDFIQTYRSLPPSSREALRNPRGAQTLLDGMIDNALWEQAAIKLGVDRDPAVQIRLANARQQILKEAAAEHMFKFSDADVLEHYKSHTMRYSPTVQYNIRRIAIKNLTDAVRIQKMLKQKPFALVAAQMSADRKSAARGGLVSFRPGGMPQTYEDRVRKMKVGEVSSPFKAGEGYEILKKEGEYDLPPLPQVLTSVRSDLIRIKSEEWANNARRRIPVQIDEKALYGTRLRLATEERSRS